MKISRANGFIDRESYVAQFLALSFLTIGVTSVVGSDDLLAAFAAGNGSSRMSQGEADALYRLCTLLGR